MYLSCFHEASLVDVWVRCPPGHRLATCRWMTLWARGAPMCACIRLVMAARQPRIKEAKQSAAWYSKREEKGCRWWPHRKAETAPPWCGGLEHGRPGRTTGRSFMNRTGDAVLSGHTKSPTRTYPIACAAADSTVNVGRASPGPLWRPGWANGQHQQRQRQQLTNTGRS
jgi:hypothetical protein